MSSDGMKKILNQNYPVSRCGSDVRNFHGIEVPDPYHWLEKPDSVEVNDWADAQHAFSGIYFSSNPDTADFHKFLQKNYSPVPSAWHCVRGTKEFYFTCRKDLAQPLLCVYDRSSGEEQVIADVNNTGNRINAEFIHVSSSGRYVAYNLGPTGSPLVTLHIYDVKTQQIIEFDNLATVSPVVAWHPQEHGYYYSISRRLFCEKPDQDRPDGVYWHGLGTAHKEDVCIFDYQQGQGHIAFPALSEDNCHLLIFTNRFSTAKSGVMTKEMHRIYPQASGQKDNTGFTPLFDGLRDYVRMIGSKGSMVFFHTLAGAPLGRVVAIDLDNCAKENWIDLIPEGELPIATPERLGGAGKAVIAGDSLLITFVKDAHDIVKHYDLKGRLIRQVDLPCLCTVDALQDNGPGFRITIQSFLIPRITYTYDMDEGLAVIEKTIPADPACDPECYQISQVFYPALDGTSIPMYLLHKPGLELNGNNPTLLYGYGGFGQSINPEYSPEIGLWLNLGGVYALANIRGGGEYGANWHEQAIREKKQTSFDDFSSAAEYLINQGYTSSRRLGIRGISNGGLLTAACLNQRPDLFAAVITGIPLVDMLGLDDSPAGESLTGEYGSPGESREMFDIIYRYSPLHNVIEHPETPPQLIVVAEKDSSAVPGQIYKYVAARQAVALPDQPVLLRIVYGEGHGDWSPSSTCKNLAEEIAFLKEILMFNSS